MPQNKYIRDTDSSLSTNTHRTNERTAATTTFIERTCEREREPKAKRFVIRSVIASKFTFRTHFDRLALKWVYV